jgi:hypothetical protein
MPASNETVDHRRVRPAMWLLVCLLLAGCAAGGPVGGGTAPRATATRPPADAGAASGPATPGSPPPSTTSSTAPRALPPSPATTAVLALEPVTTLLPEIRVDAGGSLAADTSAAAMRVPGVTFATAVAVGDVAVGTSDGRAVSLRIAGVDPEAFRVLSPQVNADTTELWQRIAEGDLAIAHEVAEARRIQLASVLDAPGGPLRVGALAANGQPPLADAVVDADVGVRLGLGEPSTLLVSVAPESWPDEVAADLEGALALPATLIYGKPQRTLDSLPPDSTVWDALAVCESSGRWDIDSGNGYYGGLQFLPSSWQLVGGTGLPHEASRDEQIHRAELLLLRQGWEAWPACSVRLGLREPDPQTGPQPGQEPDR